jgi:hypothetical protein
MIGLIPAAGDAARMFGVPKFLLPTPGGVLIDVMAARMSASCSRLFTGTQSRHYGMVNHRLGSATHTIYLADTSTMSETVLIGRRFTFDQPVLFGMPDTWFEDSAAFAKLAAAVHDGADVAVGVFEAQPGQHRKGGMCRVEDGRVLAVIDKPDVCAWPHIWGALAWRPTFWPFIAPADPHVGYALPRAIADGLNVRAVRLGGVYWDCGTPDDYFDCIAAQRVAETVQERSA